jgi:hypothetical protein
VTVAVVVLDDLLELRIVRLVKGVLHSIDGPKVCRLPGGRHMLKLTEVAPQCGPRNLSASAPSLPQ